MPGFRRAAVVVSVLWLGVPSTAAEPIELWVRRVVDEWAASSHLPRSLVDVDRLAAEAARRTAAGAPPSEFGNWLNRELRRAENAFAPAGAKHDDTVRYALPFDPRVPRLLSQGPGGSESHTGRQRESFDFVMPIGTPVRAARAGVVGQVVDGFGQTDAGGSSRENRVFVLHEDGTFGTYLHLSPGIPVRVGQRVASGDVLGKSGNTGRSTAPHLHFAVARVDPDGVDHANLPIRFGRPGAPGFVPRKNDFVGVAPKPNVPLAVSVRGKPMGPDERLSVARGDRLPIRVTLPGSARDLVGDPRLELVPMTPWNLSVSRNELAVEPMPGFSPELVPGLSDVAVLGIYYTDSARRQIGLGQVQLEIAGGGAAP